MNPPQISAATAVMYNTRLLNSNPAKLTEYDLASRSTLTILCAILELHDPPSASCLPFRKICVWHAAWITALPNFDRVGYIADEIDFYTGEPIKRLYLLADWLSTKTAREAYETALRERSVEWQDERIRWFRLRGRLIRIYGIGIAAAQAQIEAHFNALRSRFEVSANAARLVLNVFRWNDAISDEDRRAYERAVPTDGRHAYASVIDFTGMSHDEPEQS